MTDSAGASRVKDEQPPASTPTIRVTAMPADVNPYGDMFGGWMMAQMDLAAPSPLVTAAGVR